MTVEQIASLGPALGRFLAAFKRCFVTSNTFAHLCTYCRGLLSDLTRKSVEPIALAGGCAVRTLQEFLASHVWNDQQMRDEIQRRIVREHLPPPGGKPRDGIGTIGWIDETSVAKKGDKTPGVQRQYCGASGKIDNCIVTVHLACHSGDFNAVLDNDLFVPERTWDTDPAAKKRREEAHIPDHVIYTSKWLLALGQISHAMANGVRFDWLTFDEWYGGKPGFLAALEDRGLLYITEVPKNLPCFPSLPKYKSLQRPFASKPVEKAAKWSRQFKGKPWKTIKLARKTMGPQTWQVRAAQVHLARDGKPLLRTHWLIVAKNPVSGEVKYFVSNAPPRTALMTLLKVAFTRAGIEHLFRLAKTEVGFGHYEGRNYNGLIRHMTLCQLVLLFAAEQTGRLRGEKSGVDDRADGPSAQHAVQRLAAASIKADPNRADGGDHPVSSGEESSRPTVTPMRKAAIGLAL
jgi:SRSO17 transposase